MPRLTADAWENIRAEREAGATFEPLAVKYGVSKTAIVKRAKAENWGDGSDLAETIRRKVTEKVSGIVTVANPKKKAEAIDAAADRGAAIVARHRSDWEDHHARFTVNGVADDFELGKSAKICAEMLAIRQKAERSAHGFDEKEQVNLTVVNQTGIADFTLPPELQELFDKAAVSATQTIGEGSKCA